MESELRILHFDFIGLFGGSLPLCDVLYAWDKKNKIDETIVRNSNTELRDASLCNNGRALLSSTDYILID